MPINILDAVVLGVTLISAILAAIRGATREILAIISWVVAGVAAYAFLPVFLPYTQQHISHEMAAMGVTGFVIFLVTLLVVSFITVKISDVVLDSRIGAVDRALGFLFGVLRGFVLCVIGWALLSWILMGQVPESAKTAKTFPILVSSSDSLKNMIPDKALQWVQKTFLGNKSEEGESQPPAGNP
ncbi:MAG: CvpA family protein [Methylobacteriaceae bacterium]|jgi:membrane protein required for colicin V production|nr:CvpA family protein [Methylobacteriaceae bacterium]